MKQFSILLAILFFALLTGCNLAPTATLPPATPTLAPPAADAASPTSTPTETRPAPPALPPITLENAVGLQLLQTLEIPAYVRGQTSQCSVAFSPDGSLLAAACGENPVPVWEVASGQLLFTLYDASQQIVTCAFSPDGKSLACGGFDGQITLWDAANGTQIKVLGGHDAPVWTLTFSPDGKTLASCSLGMASRGSGSGDVRLWNVQTGQQLWRYAGNWDYLSLAFDPVGQHLAFGAIGGLVGVLEVSEGALTLELDDPARNVGEVAFSPSGRWLAAASDDKAIYLWEAENYTLAARLEGHARYVNGVAFSPDESLLASGGSEKTVGVWDAAAGKLIALLNGHSDAVLRVAFSPDGRRIASVSWDGTVRLWGASAEAAQPSLQAAATETPSPPTPTETPRVLLQMEKSAQNLDIQQTFQAALGDLDSDGDLDALFANPMKNPATVWLNDGSGFFSDTGQQLTQYGHGAALADFDKDGDLDAFIVCHQFVLPSKVYFNDGAGQFTDSGQDFGDGNLSAVDVNLLDFNGDGHTDVHVVYFDLSSLPDKVYLNDGAGNFTDSDLALDEYVIAWGDLDGDGDVDTFGKRAGTGIVARLNNGGQFSDGWQLADSQVTYGGIALDDFDGDGDLDALVANGFRDAGSFPTRLFWNDGNGAFVDSGQRLNETSGAELAAGDLDNDGDLDVFVSNMDLPNEIWLNNGDGSFIDSGLRMGAKTDLSGKVSLGDLDGDGDLDAVVGRFRGGAEIWLNRAPAAGQP